VIRESQLLKTSIAEGGWGGGLDFGYLALWREQVLNLFHFPLASRLARGA
jgi:hypothetical protein